MNTCCGDRVGGRRREGEGGGGRGREGEGGGGRGVRKKMAGVDTQCALRMV